MCDVVPVETVGIAEDCGRFLKRDTMFLEIGNGLRDVPRKHIRVYTLNYPRSQELRAQPVYLVFLVHLVGLVGFVCLVFLVCLVHRTKDTTQTKEPIKQER